MGTAFLVMLSFGIGTALVLLIAGLVSAKALKKLKPEFLQNSVKVKKMLGWLLLVLGLLVLTGLDKQLEILALGIMPEWATTL